MLAVCVAVVDVLFFNATAATEIYTYGHTRSLHDALPLLALQEAVRVRAGIDIGAVAAGVLAPGDLVVVVGLVFLADRDVADLLEAEAHGVGHPDVDRMPQDGMQRLGHVEVAQAAAGDAAGAGARPRLLGDDDCLSTGEVGVG